MVAGPATPVGAPGTAGDGDTDRDSDWPPVEAMDFPGKRFSLSYYKYKTLTECHFKFYLQYITGVEETITPLTGLETQILSPPLFGSLVHELFAEVLNRAGPGFSLSRKQLKRSSGRSSFIAGVQRSTTISSSITRNCSKKIKGSLQNLWPAAPAGRENPIQDLKANGARGEPAPPFTATRWPMST